MGIFTKLLARREKETGTPGIFADPGPAEEPSEAPEPAAEAAPPEEPAAEAAAEPAGAPEPPETAEAEPAAVSPPPGDDAPEESVADAFGTLVEDFFTTAVSDAEGETDPEHDEAPQVTVEGEAAAELRATFAGVAARHLLPVRQLHRRLADGPVSVDWVGLCRPAVSTVGRTAVEMDLIQLVRPFDQLAALLSRAERQGGQSIDGELRDTLLAACDELVTLFPEAFPADEPDAEARDAQESITVHAVLRQVPQIGTVSLDKIFAAGLTAMQMLAQASAEDLSATTGIAPPLADRVRDAVDHFLDQTEELREEGSPLGVLELLTAAVDELERHHRAYREAGDTAEGFARRKAVRRARQLAQLRAHTYLAALGETPLVEELQRLPLDRALDQVRRYLSSFELPGAGDALEAAAADLLEE